MTSIPFFMNMDRCAPWSYSLPPEKITGHHNAVVIEGINQQSIPWYEDPWLGQTRSVVSPYKGQKLRWCQCRSYDTLPFVSQWFGLVWASHIILSPQWRNAIDYENVTKVANILCGAPTLLANANGGKSSRTTGKKVRFGSKMSSTFLSKGGGTAKITVAKVHDGAKLVQIHRGRWA